MEQVKQEVCLIVAAHDGPDKQYRGAIGKNGKDLYDIRCDRARFQRITKGGIVLMGRRTADAIPEDYFPLKSRVNGVITRNPNWNHRGVIVKDDLETAIKWAKSINVPKIFVIGGGEIYSQVLMKKLVDRIYLTKILTPLPRDTRIEELTFLERYNLIEGENTYRIVDTGIDGESFTDPDTGLSMQFVELERR
jgi:dihydrofolate reductase